jgi:hypothetical protein
VSFRPKTCVEIICDGGCDNPWEDGIPHFDSEAEAIGWAKACKWMVTGVKALCPACAEKADCKQTGHQWDEWRGAEMHGIRYERRWCEHCGRTDYDPPFAELHPRLQALRDAEAVISDASAVWGGDRRG